MSRMDRVEIHAFSFDIPGLGPGTHSAAGVGNTVRSESGALHTSRFAARTRCGYSDQPQALSPDAHVPVPDAPGLGVEYDREFIDAHRNALLGWP